jgi:hypothetical protein
MQKLFLSAFYDLVQYNLGWIISYFLIFLMVIELVYVMVKYLGTPEKK